MAEAHAACKPAAERGTEGGFCSSLEVSSLLRGGWSALMPWWLMALVVPQQGMAELCADRGGGHALRYYPDRDRGWWSCSVLNEVVVMLCTTALTGGGGGP